VVRRTTVTLGHSVEGRRIVATAANGLGDGHGHGGGPLVLVIGCIHGDECAGIKAAKRSDVGCPPYGDGLVVVPNVNPDGLAARTRLNAHGVDLNRNFSEGWQRAGFPWDPEYSGPQPFSEPESRVARRLIRGLRPEVTIWFHQQEERLVRAWGPSVPAARTYARLAGEPFRHMPWLAGTAPNWQNHRFPGTSSFVVELPLDGPAHTGRYGQAIWQLANELS
jgi:murein peptide amidase A